jgi:tetratricopeptide (TPR) repeat protein
LLAASFVLSTWLEPRLQHWAGDRKQADGAITAFLGDSRRLFARHFYAKADAYFHNGYYPSIFDGHSSSNKSRMAAGAIAGHEAGEKCMDALGQPKDWLDRFSRHFYPSSHVHLGPGGPECKEHHDHEDGCADGHGDESKESGGAQELLPWLRVAADLDPERPETYVVGSFWMRSQVGKVAEAEQFLREGLRANPGHPEILFELGRIYHENRQDTARARNIWELALAKWREQEQPKPQPNHLLYLQILGNLAKLEEEEKQYARAIEYLNLLKEASPNKERIQIWIDELRSKSGANL